MKIYLPFLLLFIGHSVSSCSADDTPSTIGEQNPPVSASSDDIDWTGVDLPVTKDSTDDIDWTSVQL